MFGFELVGLQTMGVKCPRGNHTATLIFKPSSGDLLAPIDKSVEQGFREAGMLDHFMLPKCDDFHFLCMECAVSLRQCEETKQPCQISLPEHIKAIEKGG